MKIEHFALNVDDPDAMAVWYVKNLGLKIVKQLREPPYTHFLADSGGTVLRSVFFRVHLSGVITPGRDED